MLGQGILTPFKRQRVNGPLCTIDSHLNQCGRLESIAIDTTSAVMTHYAEGSTNQITGHVPWKSSHEVRRHMAWIEEGWISQSLFTQDMLGSVKKYSK